MKNDKVYCCFCGDDITEGQQKNPAPVNAREDSKCCDYCYKYIVCPSTVIIDDVITDALNLKKEYDKLTSTDGDDF